MGPWVTTWPYKFEEAMFKPGDKVRLKSGGPGMTVEVVGEEAKTILCAWFYEGEKKQAKFVPASLEWEDSTRNG